MIYVLKNVKKKNLKSYLHPGTYEKLLKSVQQLAKSKRIIKNLSKLIKFFSHFLTYVISVHC